VILSENAATIESDNIMDIKGGDPSAAGNTRYELVLTR